MFKKDWPSTIELYDGQAVTTDDWIHAMEKVSGRDLTQFKLWYDLAGTPEVKVNTRYSDEKLSLEVELEQTNRDPKTQQDQPAQLIPLKLGLLTSSGSPLDFTYEDQQEKIQSCVLELTEKQQSFTLHNISQKPVLSLNRDFSAPIHLKQEQSDSDLFL
jgi:aminopeptidase N